MVRDAPRKRGTYRREEWIAHSVDAGEIDRVARKNTRGQFGICAICATGESDVGMRADFKALNYRLNTTEPVMVHRLRRIPRLMDPLPIERVLTAEMADRLNKITRVRQILPEHLFPRRSAKAIRCARERRAPGMGSKHRSGFGNVVFEHARGVRRPAQGHW